VGGNTVDLEAQQSLERMLITVVVLLVGAFLIERFGDASPVVVGVSSMWTLALTFWFRTNGQGR
jgi:uncharacterized membrane protein YgaE (UPF0421/DUF939 family)